MHSSSEATDSEAGFGNECNFVDTIGLDRVSLIEKALDFASMSEGSMETETSDGGKLWGLVAMQTPFVRYVSYLSLVALFGVLERIG
jgi:hypothetical protein